MKSEFLRTITLAVLMFGCFVVAVPQVSRQIETWFQAPTREPESVRPSPPVARPNELYRDRSSARGELAFGYEDDSQSPPSASQSPASQPSARKYPVQPSSMERPVANAQDELWSWQQELERHGATFVVVEAIADHFQCRCILPAKFQRDYEKVFSADAPEPALAMRKVLEQVTLQPTSERNGVRLLPRVP